MTPGEYFMRITDCKNLNILFSMWKEQHARDPNYILNAPEMGVRVPKGSFFADGNCQNYFQASPRVLFVLREARVFGGAPAESGAVSAHEEDACASSQSGEGASGPLSAEDPEQSTADGFLQAAERYGQWVEEEQRFTQWFADGEEFVDQMSKAERAAHKQYRRDIGKIASLIDSNLSLNDIAYMDLNKRGGFDSYNPRVLERYVIDYGGFIRQEIAILDPDWIVCCGTFGYVRSVLGIKDQGRQTYPACLIWGEFGKTRKILGVRHISQNNDFKELAREIGNYSVSRR